MKYELKKASVRLRLKEEAGLYSTIPFSSPDVAVREMGAQLEEMDVENVCVLCLDTKNKPINYAIISTGDVNVSIVPIKSIFKVALLSNAFSIIILHNHPSGDLAPSNYDVEITKKIIEAGKVMELPLVDHIITGMNGNYYSFREQNTELNWT